MKAPMVDRKESPMVNTIFIAPYNYLGKHAHTTCLRKGIPMVALLHFDTFIAQLCTK